MASARIRWPNREPLLLCVPCAALARALADAMGLHVVIEELPAEEPL